MAQCFYINAFRLRFENSTIARRLNISNLIYILNRLCACSAFMLRVYVVPRVFIVLIQRSLFVDENLTDCLLLSDLICRFQWILLLLCVFVEFQLNGRCQWISTSSFLNFVYNQPFNTTCILLHDLNVQNWEYNLVLYDFFPDSTTF